MTAPDVIYARFEDDGAGWTIENYGDHPLDGDRFVRASDELVALIGAAKEFSETYARNPRGPSLSAVALAYARSVKGAAE